MKTETKAQRKFNLLARLQALGFTYEESQTLYCAQLTLHRWAEAECNGEIERNEKTGKPQAVRVTSFRSTPYGNDRVLWPIADREAGALRRVKATVDARNARKFAGLTDASSHVEFLHEYQQGDPRGCALYLVKTGDLRGQSIESVYTRGLAVCA